MPVPANRSADSSGDRREEPFPRRPRQTDHCREPNDGAEDRHDRHPRRAERARGVGRGAPQDPTGTIAENSASHRPENAQPAGMIFGRTQAGPAFCDAATRSARGLDSRPARDRQ